MPSGPGTRRHTPPTPRTTHSIPHHQQRHSGRNNFTHHPQPGPLGVLHQHLHREIPEQFASYDSLVPRKKRAHATTFTSTHHEPAPTMRVHRGRPQHKKPRRRTIHLQHLPDICKATLLLNYCLVGNQLLQQTRGAPTGSPASPALCDMVVAVCEQSWTPTYRTITYNVKHTTSPQFTLSRYFATRYVDNRLTLIPSATQHTTHFQQFLSPQFYGPPIYLETEPGLDFLGFTINPDTYSIHYKATDNLTDIMSSGSASPPPCFEAA